jgi:Reverse transcriptase (RNA-dependent DNA polymerase)
MIAGSVQGQGSETKLGTSQGAVASPLLANVYLHYLFDLWADVWRKKVANGDVIVVRYAADIVVGFQHPNGCRAFPERVPRTAGEVRLRVKSGQDTTDRVRRTAIVPTHESLTRIFLSETLRVEW